MKQDFTVGFLGFGNMATAMATGLIHAGALAPKRIFASAKSWEKLEQRGTELGICPCRTGTELADASDIVVLAVKPYLLEEVTAPIRARLSGKIVISVAAGYPFSRLSPLLPENCHCLSIMPNTPVSVGEGVVLLENQNSLSREELSLVTRLFSALGRVISVETSQLAAAGALSGCGPAFAAMFLEALGDAGVMHGLPRALSYELASQMLAGTGKLQLATGAHPGAMKDAVCSPGGTTIAGVSVLERKGLRSAVIDAVDGVMNRG